MNKSTKRGSANSYLTHTNGNKGITLIALIITIIVMLIIVAASISVAINSGLFEKAGEATGEWKLSQEEENNLKVNIAGTEYNTMEEYVGTLNETGIPWIYEQNEDGDIEITGIDFSGYSVEKNRDDGYSVDVILGVETLTIPDQIDGKDVVSVAFYDSAGTFDDGYFLPRVQDVKSINLGTNLKMWGNLEDSDSNFVEAVGCYFDGVKSFTLSDGIEMRCVCFC